MSTYQKFRREREEAMSWCAGHYNPSPFQMAVEIEGFIFSLFIPSYLDKLDLKMRLT